MVFFKNLVSKYRITTLLRAMYTISTLTILPFGFKDLINIDFSDMNTPLYLAAAFVLIIPTYLPNLLLNYSLKYHQILFLVIQESRHRLRSLVLYYI